MALSNKQKTSVGKGVRILKPLYSVGGNVKWYSHYGKRFVKKLKIELNRSRDFPGGPVAKTPCSQCAGPGFKPCFEELRSHMLQLNIPHATMKMYIMCYNEDVYCWKTQHSQINKFFHKKKRIT